MPADLSGGMLKRCAFARAMALDPRILFFDEPSAGLDPVSSASLDELILNIREKTGATILVVTHELDSIFRISDRSIMLDAETKKILADGKFAPDAELSSGSFAKMLLVAYGGDSALFTGADWLKNVQYAVKPGFLGYRLDEVSTLPVKRFIRRSPTKAKAFAPQTTAPA